ncbi:hypothetical protein L332_03375 [Agrococcus pavilionensis RW1]|uniref:Uncharacterized protein n=1 Tax=Agrococcus pavilionensis RW1 TaxID=1330458 RepID=U1MNM2_9MICO|nr:hypothetical protein [Agrococcus pavilionensis]ERG63496.1 hypothetical protein L332_03375 [Agrococcus pavilionensis RW1]
MGVRAVLGVEWESVAYSSLNPGDEVRLTSDAGEVILGTVEGSASIRTVVGPVSMAVWRERGFEAARRLPELLPGYYVDPSLMHGSSTLFAVYAHGDVRQSMSGGWRLSNRSAIPATHVRLVPESEVKALQKRIADAEHVLMDTAGPFGAYHEGRSPMLAALHGEMG